jgi:hypothetical protein
MILIRRGTMK